MSITDQDNVTVTEVEQALVPSSKHGEMAPAISNDDLKAQLVFETERRSILREFIKYHLVDGIDYGGIHINKSCYNKYSCKEKSHFSKPQLFKPGQEKFLSLMHFIVEFRPDIETKEMFGNPDGLICYNCILYDLKGRFISSGKGAASLSEGFDPNKAIKMAEKRSQSDAINRSGILADFFSIDQDQPEIAPNGSMPRPGVQVPPTRASDINLEPSLNGCTCPVKGKYHARVCPLFVDPHAADITEDPNPVIDAEMVNDGDLPF